MPAVTLAEEDLKKANARRPHGAVEYEGKDWKGPLGKKEGEREEERGMDERKKDVKAVARITTPLPLPLTASIIFSHSAGRNSLSATAWQQSAGPGMPSPLSTTTPIVGRPRQATLLGLRSSTQWPSIDLNTTFRKGFGHICTPSSRPLSLSDCKAKTLRSTAFPLLHHQY